MNGFTKCAGLVQDELDGDFTVWERDDHIGMLATVHGEDINGPYPAKENAELIAACFTSASRLAERGYDAIAVMKELPEIIRWWLAWNDAMPGNFEPEEEAILSRIRPEAKP